MLFSSIPFLYYFLPLFIIVYTVVPKAGKNSVLLLASLIFYGWGESKYVLLMLFIIGAGYVGGIILEKFRLKRSGKWFLTLFVGIEILILAYFKYSDFFIENFNLVFGTEISLLKIALPIGISFYVFQSISYLVDVWRGEVKAQRNFITLASYIAMFPQLIAGPIVRYVDVEKQLRQRKHSVSMIAQGIRRFIIGLSKKVLIANALGECCSVFRQSEESSVLFFWLYGISFMLHIYFDFSGYSDMAIGLGKMLGFSFMENFNYPYISESITEFWRRWHISLGSWFRDYVYIPMGGNRVSKPRWILNIGVVWFLTGIWHGAAWNFIIWGLYFAVFLVIEKQFLMPYIKKAKWINHIYVLFIVMVSFIIFDAVSMEEAAKNIAGLWGIGTDVVINKESIYYLKNYFVILMFAVIGATPLSKFLLEKLEQKVIGKKIILLVEPVVFAGLLLVITAYLVDGSFNPFLYFRF